MDTLGSIIIKIIKGEPFGEKNRKKCYDAEKLNKKSEIQSHPELYVTLKEGASFIFQFLVPNGPI